MAVTIQIVEDDTIVRESLAVLLESYGYRVEQFESGEAYLASDRAASAAGLFLDINLPGMDGLELLGQLAGRMNSGQVVLMTADINARVSALASDKRVAALLQKPLAPATVLTAASAFIAGPI